MRRRRERAGARWIVVASMLMAWLVLPAWAQIGAGAIRGDVLDEAGAAVPGVTLTITAVATNFGRTVISDSNGAYSVPSLPPGLYRIEAMLSGFRPLTREGVRVATGETVLVELQLEVGGVAEAITVAADAPLLRSNSGSLGQVVDTRKVVDLPLNGRSFITLALLAPGVALPPGSTLPRINGGRPRTNEYLFDGISVLQPEPGQVAFFPNVDAIQEFKVETNSPPAEFGRFNGGVINLTTKSGGNAFRGSAFEFFRNEALNARNFFASTVPEKPEFRRNQFGGVVGGPIQRDRLFFFADYQGQRQSIGRTVISTVPTALQRQGIFTEAIAGHVPVIYDPLTGTTNRTQFPGNTIPANRVDPVAQTLLARYPTPTSAGTANNYRRVDSEQVDQDQFSVRLDAKLPGNRDQVFGRLTRFREEFIPVTPLPDGSGVTTGTLGPQDTRSWAFASNYQRTFSDRMLNEVRIGDTRRSVGRTAAQLPSGVTVPGIPAGAQFSSTLPTFLIAGYQQIGSQPNTSSDFSTSVTEVADTFTWFGGRHTVKAGADLRWERLNVVQPSSPTGAYTFSNLFTDLPGTANTGTPFASFLLGLVQQFSVDLQQDPIRNRAHIEEYFVQDDWRVSERVTVNAGLRYTLNFPSSEVNDQAAVFNLTSRSLDYLGRDGNPETARQLHKNNFGPRLGVAARLTDNLVARTGFGVVWIEMAGITTPFTTPSFPFIQTVSQRTLDNIVPAFALASGPTVVPVPLTPDAGLGQGVFSVDRDLSSGYVQQWNAAVQRQFGSNVSLEVAYVGSKITRVGLPDSNLNQLSVDQLAMGSALLTRVANPYFGIVPRSSSLGDPTIPVAQLLKPYPQFTTVSLYRNNVGNTRYDGVTFKLEQRMSRGVSYLVSYTRSKLMDDASAVFDASIPTGPVTRTDHPADTYNRALERDYSAGDIPHVFVTSVVWDLPFGDGRTSTPDGVMGALVNGWTVTGLLTLQSGVPIPVTQATNNNAFAGFGIQRPNLSGDPTLGGDDRSASRWFNTGLFSPAPQFTLGSASRNPVRGPGYRNLDMAVMRRLRLAGTTSLELRGEVFNVFNTPPLGNPNGVFGSAAFGTITTAGDPRIVQLAVKLLF